ncbi:MAG: SRPBCC domain-containing protein [Bacteroidota bacterium]
MNDNLLFDFTIDKSTNTIFINREFNSALSLVWNAFTKQEILDQWWAPKPWKSRTKFMHFVVGGRRFYAMVSPEGQEHWSIQDFTFINPMENFKFFDAFTDEHENINYEITSSDWGLHFTEQADTTTVKITIKHKTLSDLEQNIQMGFKEGFTMTLNELEKLLQQ